MEFLLSILPILWLIIALCVLKMAGWKACGLTALVAAVVALSYFKFGFLNTVKAAGMGILNALWPICIVIIAALFVYNLTLETKAMEDIKKMLSSVSSDKMLILLIIGFAFGNFMEGMAGFGTAVAIPAGILVAMGYDPIATVVACLVANSTPTAFGSVGVPTTTLAGSFNMDAKALSADLVNIQAVLTFLAPFVMVAIVGGGIKALKKSFGICLLASLSFAVPQYIAGRFIGPELPDILGSVICLIVLVLVGISMEKKKGGKKIEITGSKALAAWCPFILIFIFLLFTSSLVAPVSNFLGQFKSLMTFDFGKFGKGQLGFAWLGAPGLKIILAGVIGGFVQGASFKKIVKVFFRTIKENVKTIFTICSVLATAQIMGYSGMIAAIATILVKVAGNFYPAIAPLVGTIGGFVTGSGTSTAVLFGGIQAKAASTLGINETWLGAANNLGGGIGKMISPQGIAIGCAASGLGGQESKVMNKTIPYAIAYVIIAGIVSMIGASL